MTHRMPFFIVALGLARCASTPLAPEVDPRQPVILQDADQVNTPVAQAVRLHLQRARAEIAVARRMDLEGNGRSEEMWARAQADTDLALGLTREAAVHGAAGDATRAQSLARSTPGAGAP